MTTLETAKGRPLKGVRVGSNGLRYQCVKHILLHLTLLGRKRALKIVLAVQPKNAYYFAANPKAIYIHITYLFAVSLSLFYSLSLPLSRSLLI